MDTSALMMPVECNVRVFEELDRLLVALGRRANTAGFGLEELGVALLGAVLPDAGWLRPGAWAFLVGIILFSGSLYALVFSGVRMLGMITPIGGVAFLVGWGCLVVAGFRAGSGS